jgi:hypothetical protein
MHHNKFRAKTLRLNRPLKENGIEQSFVTPFELNSVEMNAN